MLVRVNADKLFGSYIRTLNLTNLSTQINVKQNIYRNWRAFDFGHLFSPNTHYIFSNIFWSVDLKKKLNKQKDILS